MKVKILPAFNGDCIIIQHHNQGKNHNVLIDGGIPRTYSRYLKPELQRILDRGEDINLLITTHIDNDHIGGIIKLFEDQDLDKNFIKEIWFNSGELLSKYLYSSIDEEERSVKIIPSNTTLMSVGQGITLENELRKHGGWKEKLIIAGQTSYFVEGLELIVVSPDEHRINDLNKKWVVETDDRVNMSASTHDDFTIPISELIKKSFKEDKAIPNGSSIALIANFNDKSILLLGDAHPSVVASSIKKLGYSGINKLKIDALKVSHHASKANTSNELLELLNCKNFIICTDGSKHGLPDKEALARIIAKFPDCNLYFNYKNDITESIFLPEDRANYNFNCLFLENTEYTFNI